MLWVEDNDFASFVGYELLVIWCKSIYATLFYECAESLIHKQLQHNYVCKICFCYRQNPSLFVNSENGLRIIVFFNYGKVCPLHPKRIIPVWPVVWTKGERVALQKSSLILVHNNYLSYGVSLEGSYWLMFWKLLKKV